MVHIPVIPGHRGQEAAGLPRLAGEAVGKQHRLIAQVPGGACGGGAQLPDAAGDVSFHIVQGLGGLLAQQLHGPLRKGKAVLFHNLQGLPAGGAVRIGRAGGDHVQGVPNDV